MKVKLDKLKFKPKNRRREATGERKSEQTGQNVFAIYTQSLKQVEKAIKKAFKTFL